MWPSVYAWTGTLKNPTKCLWRWEPDCRFNFFFNLPAHLRAVTCITEISLHVTISNQSLSLNKLYGRLRLIRSVLRPSSSLCFKVVEIVILRVYYTMPFGLIFFLASHFTFLNYFVWLRITDEGSVPEMRLWSILRIKSD